MEGIQKITDLVASLESQGSKLFVDNKNTSATELRKTLQDIRKACKEARDEALVHQKKLKADNKAKKADKPAGEKKAKEPKAPKEPKEPKAAKEPKAKKPAKQ